MVIICSLRQLTTDSHKLYRTVVIMILVICVQTTIVFTIFKHHYHTTHIVLEAHVSLLIRDYRTDHTQVILYLV